MFLSLTVTSTSPRQKTAFLKLSTSIRNGGDNLKMVSSHRIIILTDIDFDVGYFPNHFKSMATLVSAYLQIYKAS